jgi:hypothetical protein
MIENTSDKPWSWIRISQNPNVSIEYVLSHLDKEWDWDLLMYSMRWHDIRGLRSIPAIPWNWTKLSFNPHIRLQDVLENMDVEWHWTALSSRLCVSERDIRHSGIPWDWSVLSRNPYVSLETVGTLLSSPWDWTVMSSNSFTFPRA